MMAEKEGRNPGIHNPGCYYSADPNGFLIGLLDDEPIATIPAIISNPGSIDPTAILGMMQNGRLSGYGVIRTCLSDCKICPLYSESPELAESFFLSLKLDSGPTEPIYLDIPEINRADVALAECHNMKVVFEMARMYTEIMPDLPLNQLFGVTSFGIGGPGIWRLTMRSQKK